MSTESGHTGGLLPTGELPRSVLSVDSKSSMSGGELREPGGRLAGRFEPELRSGLGVPAAVGVFSGERSGG